MSSGDDYLVQQKSQTDLSHCFGKSDREVCVALKDDKPTCSEW